jgi:excisionase family DNA binding protein
MQETLDFRDPEWVAEKLNLDKNAVYRYLNEGALPGIQLGRKWLISESSLAEFLKAEERRQTEERRQVAASDFPAVQRLTNAARDEAIRRQHNWIGTEHLLLALAADSDNAAVLLLSRLTVESSAVVAAVELLISPGATPVAGAIGLTPRAKKALKLADAEAERLNHSRVGLAHVLLGLIAQGDGIAAQALKSVGVTLEAARGEAGKLATEE